MAVEIPSANAFRFLKTYERFGYWRKGIELTANGVENVPTSGPVSAIANHRNDRYDLPSIGLVLKDQRTFFTPAKIELKKGLRGQLMEGCGALFFVREDPAERRRIAELMDQHIKQGHMVLTLAEGTSKIEGSTLGPMNRSPLKLAEDNDLDELILIGVGGTDTPLDPETMTRPIRPKHVHIEIGSLALPGAFSSIKERKDFQTEVVVPSLQEIVDIAYERAAA